MSDSVSFSRLQWGVECGKVKVVMAVVNSRDFWLNLFFRSLFYHCTNIYIYIQ